MSEVPWYYSRAGQQFGPMPRAQIDQLFSAGQIFPNDFLWTPGMPQWLPAAQLFPGTMNYAPGIALNYSTFQYAAFWQRFAAWFIDQVLLFAVNSAINLPVTLRYGMKASDNPSLEEIKMRTTFLLFNFIATWLYYSILESSPAQATLGKLLLGLRVTDLAGQRISFPRATGRFLGKLLSTLLLFLGFLMAAFTERKQALHDLMAGTLVVQKPR